MMSGVRRAARKRHEFVRSSKSRLGRIWRTTLEAITTTIAILIISVFAAAAALAALTFAAPQMVSNGQWIGIGAACALSGVLAAVFYSIRREAEAANWARMERQLDTRVTPDSGYYTHRLEVRKSGKERDFTEQFALIPRDAREALLVLRQNASRNPRDAGYEASSIRDQVMKADDHLARLDTPRIAWLALTDRKGRFVAYESYDAFRTQALRSGVRGYADVLNVRDVEEFNTRIAPHIGTDFSAHVLEEGTSKRDALAQMMAQGWDHAMIVSRGDGKPVGVATLRGLIGEIFPGDAADAARVEPAASETPEQAVEVLPVVADVAAAEPMSLQEAAQVVLAEEPMRSALVETPVVETPVVEPAPPAVDVAHAAEEAPAQLATLIAPVSEVPVAEEVAAQKNEVARTETTAMNSADIEKALAEPIVTAEEHAQVVAAKPDAAEVKAA